MFELCIFPNEEIRHEAALPALRRESSLEFVQICDRVIEADIEAAHEHDASIELIEGLRNFKKVLHKQLTDLAELRYTAGIQERVLEFMDEHRDTTREEAVRIIESIVLQAMVST